MKTNNIVIICSVLATMIVSCAEPPAAQKEMSDWAVSAECKLSEYGMSGDKSALDNALDLLVEGAKHHDLLCFEMLSELYSDGKYVVKDSLLADYFLSEIDYYTKHKTIPVRIRDSTVYFWKGDPLYYNLYVNNYFREEPFDEFIQNYIYDAVFQRDRTIVPYKQGNKYRDYEEYTILYISDYEGKTNIVKESDDAYAFDVYHYRTRYAKRYHFIKKCGKWYMSEISSFSIPEQELPERGEYFYDVVLWLNERIIPSGTLPQLAERVKSQGDLMALNDIWLYYRDSLEYYAQYMLDVWHKDEVAYKYLYYSSPSRSRQSLLYAFEGAKRKVNTCLNGLWVDYYYWGGLVEKDSRIASYFKYERDLYPEQRTNYLSPYIFCRPPLSPRK